VLTALRQIPPELRGALAPGRERDG